MGIIEPIIRPPSEAASFLLQITTGCSDNHCTFCAAYKSKKFTIKPYEEIFSDIEDGRKRFPETRRVFLMDGDALAIKNSKLLPVLQKLEQAFPKLSRISSYANGYNIIKRNESELEQLRKNKLNLLYMGLESGDQRTLDRCKKQSTVEEMVTSVKAAQVVKIKSSVIVLLGLGGRAHSDEHVEGTSEALNLMQPRYLSFLSLMVIPGTELYEETQKGLFRELSAEELLREAYGIIKGLDLKKTIFRSNHASNHLALEGRFPQDKEKLLKSLEQAIDGKIGLKPDFLRGL